MKNSMIAIITVVSLFFCACGIDDVADVSAPIFHLGPLTKWEIPIEVIKALSKRGLTVSLDVQGFLRDIKEGVVSECDWEEKKRGLSFIDILFVYFDRDIHRDTSL